MADNLAPLPDPHQRPGGALLRAQKPGVAAPPGGVLRCDIRVLFSPCEAEFGLSREICFYVKISTSGHELSLEPGSSARHAGGMSNPEVVAAGECVLAALEILGGADGVRWSLHRDRRGVDLVRRVPALAVDGEHVSALTYALTVGIRPVKRDLRAFWRIAGDLIELRYRGAGEGVDDLVAALGRLGVESAKKSPERVEHPGGAEVAGGSGRDVA